MFVSRIAALFDAAVFRFSKTVLSVSTKFEEAFKLIRQSVHD
jgi:hypothetical protein